MSRPQPGRPPLHFLPATRTPVRLFPTNRGLCTLRRNPAHVAFQHQHVKPQLWSAFSLQTVTFGGTTNDGDKRRETGVRAACGVSMNDGEV